MSERSAVLQLREFLEGRITPITFGNEIVPILNRLERLSQPEHTMYPLRDAGDCNKGATARIICQAVGCETTEVVLISRQHAKPKTIVDMEAVPLVDALARKHFAEIKVLNTATRLMLTGKLHGIIGTDCTKGIAGKIATDWNTLIRSTAHVNLHGILFYLFAFYLLERHDQTQHLSPLADLAMEYMPLLQNRNGWLLLAA